MAWTGGLTENKGGSSPGEDAYQQLCASCHGDRREGSPPTFPSLIDVGARLSNDNLASVIRSGKGRMPSFPMLDDKAMAALVQYLKSNGPAPNVGPETRQASSNDKQEMAATAQHSNDPVGAKSYADHCAICHGDEEEGISPSFPALKGVGNRMPREQIVEVVHQGKGRMPGFPKLEDEELASLIRYLGVSDLAAAKIGGDTLKYRFTGYRKFLDPDGYPAISPPWGTLNAIDLNTGKYLWKIPFGEYPELAASGTRNTGSENYGGPIVTAGGLVFIGATDFDRKFHAYDNRTGELLWEALLPFAGVATPVTYMVDGKQYVVIAAGGGRDPKWPTGGVYVAFALP
jgi:mono/diheme cytochrome c family protein